MTTRTILLTLAASVAPLYAQQPASPAPAAQVFTALTAPAATQTTPATPEQRAELFSALALLPQNVSDFAVLTKVGDNLRRLAESRKLPSFDAADLPAELLALDNIALATTPATPATYALLQQVLVNLSTVNSSLQLAEEWATNARETLSDPIIEELIQRADAHTQLDEGAAAGARIPASYIIITSKPEEETMLQECNALLLASFLQEPPAGVTPVNDANGFSGIRMDVTETYKDELDEATSDMAPRRREQLLNELAKHPLFILTRQQGQALIIALCEDPQELQLAASPAESVLATDKLAACDTNLAKGMIAASHVSPELASVANAVNSQPTFHLASGVSAVFTRLGKVEPDNKAAYDKAAAAVSLLSAELQKFHRPVTRPVTMQMWCDGDLHLALTGDGQGCSYTPGALRLASMADAPATSLYAETTPMQLGLTPPDNKALLESALSLAEGVSLTMKESNREQTEAAFAAVRAFMPEMQALVAAGSTVSSGLDGQFALVLDSVHGQLPKVSATTPGYTDAEVPRISLFAGVKDRSKLGSGWEALLATAGQLAGKFGAPPEIVRLLPITSQQLGSAMSYSLALPAFPISTQDTVPNLTVSDTGLAFGTSALLNAQVVESATGSTPFAGAVFALKFAPLARTLRSLATALDPSAEEAEPVASSEVKLDDEGGQKATVAVATVGGEDGPTSVIVATERSEVQEAADNLNVAATIFEYASTIAEGVYGTSTIEQGQSTIRLQIKLK